MRTDALKNRLRLLDAIVELILTTGGEPSRDSIAALAGVGIGTLYRHFPDRQALLHAVSRHALENCIEAGETILRTEPNGEEALRRYMHAALDHGIGVVSIVYPLLENRDWPDLHERAAALLKALIAGALRDPRVTDLSERDIVFASIRFSRPLAAGLSAGEERAIAHRHLDFYVDGLLEHGNGDSRSKR
jgi:AcrR family transcriptional regulator